MTTRDKMIELALDAMQHAYAPYSRFPVGAALLARSGTGDGTPQLFAGCNVENSSYGLTLCAERSAISAALVHRHDEFLELAIASRGGMTPCGACRQVISEFHDNLSIVLVDSQLTPPTTRIVHSRDLLPDGFRFNR